MAHLDREQIAAAALAVLDRFGLEGFTIRAVAKVLGATPMAIYYYVKDKAELAALVVNTVHTENPLAAPTGIWREDLWTIARWSREATIIHPAAYELRSVYKVYTPDIVRTAELWLTIWQKSGLAPKAAITAARVSSMTIGGLIMEESILRNLDKPRNALLAQRPKARLMFQTEEDPGAVFELTVRSLIDGLYERLKSKRKSGARPSRR